MDIIGYEDIDRNKWDEFVFSNKGGYAYFLYDVVALDRWKNDKNISFCICEKNEIYLLAQLHIEERKELNAISTRLHSRWGYILKDNLPRRVEKRVCNKYIEYIDSLFKEHDIISFDTAVPPLTETNWPGKNSINPLMKIGFKPSIRYTWINIMKGDEEELLAKCEQTTRQAIRKFKNSNEYKIIEAKGTKEDFEIYKELHIKTYIRTRAENEIIYDEYHENIFYNLVPNRRARVFFLKNSDNVIIAAIMILLYKNTAYYWWGVSDDVKDIGCNKYLLWEVMQIVRSEYTLHPDMRYPVENPDVFIFETGGAYPYLRSGKYKGLNDFKKCFGCELHPIFTGIYEYEKTN